MRERCVHKSLLTIAAVIAAMLAFVIPALALPSGAGAAPETGAWAPAVTWTVGDELEGQSDGYIAWDRSRCYWSTCLGVARYGATYVFGGTSDLLDRWEAHGPINAIPFKFVLPPKGNDGPKPLGNALAVLPAGGYDRFIGVCEIGSPQPDIWALYTKREEPGRVFWRQHTEQYNKEHSFTWPGGRTVDDVLSFDTVNRDQLIGRVVAFGGGLTFVSAAPGSGAAAVNIVTVDPLTGDLIDQTAVPAGRPLLRSVDACATTYHGVTKLAVAFLGGSPGTPVREFKSFGYLTSAAAELVFLDEDLAVLHQTSVPLDMIPAPDPPRGGFSQGYSTRDIAVVQGGVSGASRGDALQVFTRGGWVGNPYYYKRKDYHPEDWTVVSRFGWSLDRGSWSDFAATPGGVHPWPKTGASGKPGLQMRFSAFTVFPVLGEETASRHGDFLGYRQYFIVNTAAKFDQGSADNGYLYGFAGDILKPVAREVSPVTGEEVTYPSKMALTDDPSTWQLVGVVYGPPPFSLQGYDYKDLKSPSSFSFERSHSATTSTETTMGGSVTAKEKFVLGEFSQTFGLTQVETGSATTSNKIGFSFRHDSARKADNGYFICNKPNYEVQAYTRKDWAGGDIPESRLFVTRCVNRQGDQTLTYVPFDMVDPDESPVSKGMARHARCSDFGNELWSFDPELRPGMTGNWSRLSRVLLTADVDGGPSKASVTRSKEQATTSNETVKLAGKWPFFETGFEYGVKATTKTGDADNTECFLDLAEPKARAKGTLARRLEVEAFWLQADTTAAYWIPEAFRTAGNSQRPWCIDYRVVSWLPWRDDATRADDAARTDAEEGGAARADAVTCSLAPDAQPANGGTVTIAGSADPVDVAVGESVALRARPADGYAFSRWVVRGSQAKIAKRTTRSTTVSVRDGGGATVQAVFRPLLPSRLTVRRRGGDVCDVHMSDAPLPSVLRAPADPAALDVAVRLGDDSYTCPSFQEVQSGLYVASFVPYGWGKRARLTVRIDQDTKTWSLAVARGADTADLLLGCVNGNAAVGLEVGGTLVTGKGFPIAARSRIARARSVGTRPAGLDLSGATLATSCPGGSRSSTASMKGVKVSRRLLNRKGFTMDVNGVTLYVGPFVRHGSLFTYSGRTPAGVRVRCRYQTNGRLDLTLSGVALNPLLDQLVGQNVTMRITRGGRSAQANLITTVKKLSVSAAPTTK